MLGCARTGKLLSNTSCRSTPSGGLRSKPVAISPPFGEGLDWLEPCNGGEGCLFASKNEGLVNIPSSGTLCQLPPTGKPDKNHSSVTACQLPPTGKPKESAIPSSHVGKPKKSRVHREMHHPRIEWSAIRAHLAEKPSPMDGPTGGALYN